MAHIKVRWWREKVSFFDESLPSFYQAHNQALILMEVRWGQEQVRAALLSAMRRSSSPAARIVPPAVKGMCAYVLGT